MFRRLQVRLTLAMGRKGSLFVFAFFTPAITLPFAAHWSDTEPTVGSEI
jgi:hypothetical protein